MSEADKNLSAVMFDDFNPGQSLGCCELDYDVALVQGWRRIFGESESEAGAGSNSQAEAASAAVILMMRAYLDVVSPRPPGNIQAKQSIAFATLPVAGDRLSIAIDCRAKEMKRGRRYVELLARGRNQDGTPVFQGLLTLVWAA